MGLVGSLSSRIHEYGHRSYFSYHYYSDDAISYPKYKVRYNIMAQPHGLTRS